jgi:hypothetical protein
LVADPVPTGLPLALLAPPATTYRAPAGHFAVTSAPGVPGPALTNVKSFNFRVFNGIREAPIEFWPGDIPGDIDGVPMPEHAETAVRTSAAATVRPSDSQSLLMKSPCKKSAVDSNKHAFLQATARSLARRLWPIASWRQMPVVARLS